jgi:hypothetical protein
VYIHTEESIDIRGQVLSFIHVADVELGVHALGWKRSRP